jgi:hypothetical protein
MGSCARTGNPWWTYSIRAGGPGRTVEACTTADRRGCRWYATVLLMPVRTLTAAADLRAAQSYRTPEGGLVAARQSSTRQGPVDDEPDPRLVDA